jgi:hypothetical protein
MGDESPKSRSLFGLIIVVAIFWFAFSGQILAHEALYFPLPKRIGICTSALLITVCLFLTGKQGSGLAIGCLFMVIAALLIGAMWLR